MSAISDSSPHPLHPYDGSDAVPFEAFVPFVRTREDLLENFIKDLRVLYESTGDLWIPTGCLDHSSVRTAASGLCARGRFAIIAAVSSMTYAVGGHHFLNAATTLGENLVIDPFGVPPPGVNYSENKRLIAPFFGESCLAPDGHKNVYDKAIPGSRRFIP